MNTTIPDLYARQPRARYAHWIPVEDTGNMGDGHGDAPTASILQCRWTFVLLVSMEIACVLSEAATTTETDKR